MKISKLLLERYSPGEKQTIGNLIGVSEVGHTVFECDSLEPPWLDNKQNISCIPTGSYKLKKRYSKKYKHHLHVQDVENRTFILIHAGNYYTQTLGCILVGKLGYINNDDIIDVGSSKKTLKRLINSIEFDNNNEIELTVINRL